MGFGLGHRVNNYFSDFQTNNNNLMERGEKERERERVRPL